MSRRGLLVRLALWSVLILLVALAWAWFGGSDLATAATIVAGLLTVLSTLQVGRLRWSAPESSPEQVDQAAEMLSVEVHKQWEEEARHRKLGESRQMPVRWEISDLSTRSGNGWRGLPTAGQLPQLVDAFAARPAPMVVIGEPGSGKSGLCVILTLDLLKEASRDRIPVLLQVSSWDPEENFDNWLVRRLLEDYSFLGNETRFGGTAVREVVAQRRLLPVLDGLDEMPDERRQKALKAIEDDWSSAQPFVLTCRADEFVSARAVNVLTDVLIIKLLPLEPQAAANYLLESVPDVSLESWDPVLTEIVEHPAGTPATVLTKPLMLFLARAAYDSAPASPTELLDKDRFKDAADLEKHLLDRFIPTVFRTRPARAVPNPTRPAKSWDPIDAERVLTFLAGHLSNLGTRDLAWWQMHERVPRSFFLAVHVLIGTSSCGLLGWIQFGLFGKPVLGALLGLGVGIAAALGLALMWEAKPRKFVPRILRKNEMSPELIIQDVGFGLVGAFAGYLIVGLLYNVRYGILIGLFFGLIFGVVRRFTEPTESKEAVTPLRVLAADRRTVLYGAALGAMAGAIVGATMGGVVGSVAHGLIFRLSPMQEGALGAAVGLVMGAAGLGMVLHATSTWGQFTWTRLWLAYQGHAPVYLMTFLEDARKLGVLRRVGAAYQFRHAMLQEWLLARRP